MSCKFSDITTRERIAELVGAMDQLSDTLTAEQLSELATIGEILDTLPPMSIDDQLHAIRDALEEIASRE